MTSSTKSMIRRTEQALGSGSFAVMGRTVVGPSPPSYAPIPAQLNPLVRSYLAARHPRGLYRHQALAIEALLQGEDVCQATETASGKTVAFLAYGLHLLLEEPGAKVFALYPTKALLQDQLEKWRVATEGFGLTVERIDGSVATRDRLALLEGADVALLTPDVVHAWVMNHLADERLRGVLQRVRLLVLDEAHIYEGAFGANFAYLLRRFEQAAQRFRLVSATATLGDPAAFMKALTGRTTRVLTSADSGAPTNERHVWVAQCSAKDTLRAVAQVVAALCRADGDGFLVFVDSRKMVERVCQLVHRQLSADAQARPLAPGHTDGAPHTHPRPITGAAVLPYRAGYEEADRAAIQRSLAAGNTRGVISTSGLELGLDIGDIRRVICVGMPSSLKSLRQRIGRAGRRGPACCVVLDTARAQADGDAGVERLLDAPVEPNRLYLDNRYLQYAQALCAAQELRDLGRDAGYVRQSFASLPVGFRKLLANELRPARPVPPELYKLKQRCAQASPHLEFPLRGDIEASLSVVEREFPLGKLTYAQALREAYPGAIYLHLARAYRVQRFNLAKRELRVRPVRAGSTRPIQRATVFPDLVGGVRRMWRSPAGFVAEVELQVSEQVLGFTEQHGAKRTRHMYEAGSPHAQRPLSRFITSTGVCWRFEGMRQDRLQPLAELLAEATALRFDLQRRDLGAGRFFARAGDADGARLRGGCVYDTTFGSLRLSGMLLGDVEGVIDQARTLCAGHPAPELLDDLNELLRHWEVCAEERHVDGSPSLLASAAATDDRVRVIAPGSRAIYHKGTGPQEVVVKDLRYAPHGVLYLLDSEPGVRHLVRWASLEPIHGVSHMAWFDPNTHDIDPESEADNGATA